MDLTKIVALFFSRALMAELVECQLVFVSCSQDCEMKNELPGPVHTNIYIYIHVFFQISDFYFEPCCPQKSGWPHIGYPGRGKIVSPQTIYVSRWGLTIFQMTVLYPQLWVGDGNSMTGIRSTWPKYLTFKSYGSSSACLRETGRIYASKQHLRWSSWTLRDSEFDVWFGSERFPGGQLWGKKRSYPKRRSFADMYLLKLRMEEDFKQDLDWKG